jgi:MYXO-CTERM domain-containing protein
MAKNNTRLDNYFANVSALRRSASDWRIYAAVTGSAMAMATNASAGVIYFSQTVTAGPLASVAMSNQQTKQSKNIALKDGVGGNIGVGFGVYVLQFWNGLGSLGGSARLTGSGGLKMLDSGGSRLKKLASGANISAAAGPWVHQTGLLAHQTATTGGLHNASGWAANATGLAGFRFSTTNHALDYGWVRLSYTLGSNGLAKSITASEWAYDPTGAPVTAGEEGGSSTPEPSTTALAILAAGAAGVAALRRRRHDASETACPTSSDAAS